MPRIIGGETFYCTQEAATNARISKATLLRWLRDGTVREPKRDRRNWRIFSAQDVEEIKACAQKVN